MKKKPSRKIKLSGKKKGVLKVTSIDQLLSLEEEQLFRIMREMQEKGFRRILHAESKQKRDLPLEEKAAKAEYFLAKKEEEYKSSSYKLPRYASSKRHIRYRKRSLRKRAKRGKVRGLRRYGIARRKRAVRKNTGRVKGIYFGGRYKAGASDYFMRRESGINYLYQAKGTERQGARYNSGYKSAA